MNEFDLIRRIQRVFRDAGLSDTASCAVGIGDDAAVLDLPPGQQAVVCTDTLVEGVHFFPHTPAASLGYKALAVNLSDLAAMGARPAWFFTSLTLPRANPGWVDEFAAGLASLAKDSGAVLAGGDTTRGPLNICITAVGLVPPGLALTRSGAEAGDLVVVSGAPGAAANALSALEAGEHPDPEGLEALNRPVPRLELGRAIRGLATACIDLSDGLLADLGHILENSGVGARLYPDRLPLTPGLRAVPEADRRALQLSGGDDYELCFTLPRESKSRLDAIAERVAPELTVIGEIENAPGLRLVDASGQSRDVSRDGGRCGFDHFAKAADEPA